MTTPDQPMTSGDSTAVEQRKASEPFYAMHVGDTRQVLAALPASSVDLVLTSPPFLGLRSYLQADDPAKAHEMGSEATPGAFVDALLDVIEACDRVLTPHGSIVIELGDTYSAARGYGSEGSNPLYGERADERWREARVERNFKRKDDTDWPEEKSLCLVPESVRWALAYGRNPFTGRETPRWRVRNVVRWVRPNPPVGALGDKFRPATSDILIACHARDRWFDLDAVRVPSDYDRPNLRGAGARRADAQPAGQRKNTSDHTVNPAGAPPLDWWHVAPSGFTGAHYAVYPTDLLLRPIKAMCPERVCTVCGEPSRRITEQDPAYVAARAEVRERKNGSRTARDDALRRNTGNGAGAASAISNGLVTAARTTLGWTDCGHGAWRPGVVLDPFLGSGTTMHVAHGHGRSCIGIDLDRRNVDLVMERMGMWGPTVTDHLLTERSEALGA